MSMTEPKASLSEALEVLLRFGTLMLRAGDTAFRVRDAMGMLADSMGLDRLDLQVTLNSMTATVRRGEEYATLTREIAPIGINSWRIAELERLAQAKPRDLTPKVLGAKLDAIEAVPSLRPVLVVAIAIGLASGSFSYLNGGDLLGTVAAAIAGGLGQGLRALLFIWRGNQYAVTALCAVFTAGLYCLLIAALAPTGFGPGHAAGFIFSVLFLVPGFPLIAGLLDLMQHQLAAGIVRLFYGVMILLAAAIGLSAVAAVAGLTVAPAPTTAYHLDAPTIALRALASLVGGCGFAILYNSSTRAVIAVGILSLLGNDLRLVLYDFGMPLAPATFCGALLVGLLASLVRAWWREPRIALTVPSIIIMTPGLYAFQTIVMLNQDEVLPAMQAGASCFFIVGGMAMGLAAARFVTERRWLVED
jgi:uncharacterized membrane protein YjjP (DUF1212 family)